MDFFDTDFAKVFLEKHGKAKTDEIIKQIKQESIGVEIDNRYIEIIFKTAFFDFFGLNAEEIKGIIEDFMPSEQVDVKNTKDIHKSSINNIQRCIQEVMNSSENNKE